MASRPKGMEFQPRDYYQAATERLKQSNALYQKDDTGVNHHSLALYTTGVAVECLLRASITRRTKEFDGRHDLLLLFQESGILELDSASVQPDKVSDQDLQTIKKELGAAVGYVNRVWSNNFRYASDLQLRSHLHKSGIDRGIKGDALKEILRRLLDASNKIINRGVILWETLNSGGISWETSPLSPKK